MAVITKGTTFANGDQVTAGSLNNLVDNAAFASGAVDNVSTQLSSGAVIVKDGGVSTAKLPDSAVTTAKINDSAVTTAKLADSNVTTSKIADSNVTKAKIENVADMKVLGNTSGSAAAPQEVSVLDEDDMSSNSATALATQQSIKAYVDNSVPSSPSVASFTKASGTLSATGLITGYSESDPDGIASESSGTITVTGAGTYLINFGGVYYETGSGSMALQYRVDGGAVMTNPAIPSNPRLVVSYSVPKVISSGTFTVDIRAVESGVGNLIFTDVRIDIIKIA